MKKIILLFLLIISIPTLYAHGIPDADKQAMVDGGYFEYMILGAKHMLTGYDHLLFLFGVMFFLKSFRSILVLITAFTLGHSITLIVATFLEITANYYLIDAIIALTVIYKAFDNLDGFKKYLNINMPNIAIMVFTFGLIHGFGLSTRLQQLPLGDENLLGKILSFNLGVEIGQVIALSIIFVFLNLWRKTTSFNQFSVIANLLLMLAGLLLFISQMMGFFGGEKHPDFREGGGAAHSHDAAHDHSSSTDNSQDTEEGDGAMHSHDDGVPHSHGSDANTGNLDDSVQTPPDSTEAEAMHSHDGGTPHSHEEASLPEPPQESPQVQESQDSEAVHSHDGGVPHSH